MTTESDIAADHSRRWNTWLQANAASARRGDRLARIVGISMLAATFTALAIALWR